MSAPELDSCLTEMERRGIDALVLGREANARAVSGADRLWLSGTRPFAPGCVVVRTTAAVHLLSNSNDGFEAFPIDHCYPVTWNPTKMLAALAAIPGLATARTVGALQLGELCERLEAQAGRGPVESLHGTMLAVRVEISAVSKRLDTTGT